METDSVEDNVRGYGQIAVTLEAPWVRIAISTTSTGARYAP